MTKVCTHGREARWPPQCWSNPCDACKPITSISGKSTALAFDNDPELFIRPNGAAEALRKAKEQGKVRFLGFTGHKDPAIHLKMIETGFPLRRGADAAEPFRCALPEFCRRKSCPNATAEESPRSV